MVSERTTALPGEVANFAKLADEWWRPDGKFRPLHALNPLRVAFVTRHLTRHFGLDADAAAPLAGLRVLDIGCGGGIMSEPLARAGAAVTGIDAAETAIEVARLHASQHGLDIAYQQGLPEDLVANDTPFDAIVCMEVVEHVADLHTFIRAATALTRPSGALVLATLNRTVKSLALAKIGAEYVLRWLPPGTHDWRRFVRPSELARALRHCGADVGDVAGMSFNPLNGIWSFSRDLDVNYIVYARR